MTQLLLALQVARFLETWLSGTDPVQYTPKGLAWASEWGTLRYTMNAALIAEIVAKHIASTSLPLASSLSAPLLFFPVSVGVCVCVRARARVCFSLFLRMDIKKSKNSVRAFMYLG